MEITDGRRPLLVTVAARLWKGTRLEEEYDATESAALSTDTFDGRRFWMRGDVAGNCSEAAREFSFQPGFTTATGLPSRWLEPTSLAVSFASQETSESSSSSSSLSSSVVSSFTFLAMRGSEYLRLCWRLLAAAASDNEDLEAASRWLTSKDKLLGRVLWSPAVFPESDGVIPWKPDDDVFAFRRLLRALLDRPMAALSEP
mmetsp:Transcript_63414/g.163166  ORF Transcript_63414/g.163166 Transcript_63414/m.163166 type:complete len:201 (+) Transcript_63414:2006-2608(+)